VELRKANFEPVTGEDNTKARGRWALLQL